MAKTVWLVFVSDAVLYTVGLPVIERTVETNSYYEHVGDNCKNKTLLN